MLVKGETGTEELLCFQKIIFCLALYTEEANLQTFVMIECKTVCRNYLRSESFILVNVFFFLFFFKSNIFTFSDSKNECKLYKKVCREYNLEAHFQ